MFRNGCVIKKHGQLRKICCPPPLSDLKCDLIISSNAYLSLAVAEAAYARVAGVPRQDEGDTGGGGGVLLDSRVDGDLVVVVV